MPQVYCQLNGVPVWDAWGSAKARTWHLHAPLTLTWADASTDLIAPTGNATAILLPEGTATFDQTAHEYLVIGWQGSQAASPLSTGATHQLYLARIKDQFSLDTLLAAALGSTPGWAILRWIQRVVHQDWEQ